MVCGVQYFKGGRRGFMARIIHLIAGGALLVSASAVLGQATGQTAAQNRSEQSASLAAGTALNAELSHPLDSKQAKPGDAVAAQTTEAVKVDGKIVIPNNTKLVGHVTRASARAKGDAASVLAMQFDRAVLKDGRQMPLQVTLQAMAADQGTPAVSGDDLQPMGNIEGGAAEAGAVGNRGTVGGVGSTVGGAASGAASTVPRTVEQNGPVNSTAGAAKRAGQAAGGLSSSGELKPTSRGVYGLNGITLNANAANSTDGALIVAAGKNVHLDSGTRLLLVTQATTSASAQR
jgi:hypothetical protein